MQTSYQHVKLLSGYLKEKEELNRKVTLDAVYGQFVETGRIEAFNFSWKEGMPNRPHFFWDSDVAKWMEGAAYQLAREKDADLEEKVESLIDCIEKHQGEDGYFNIYFTVIEPEKRFTNRDWHELYCAGHLTEAAVAYYEATGKDRFLRLMEKYVEYIAKVFMDEGSAPYETPGHEEIELALYRLYKVTGKERYLDLMKHFLERRGQPDNTEAQIFNEAHYAQSYAPIRQQKEAYGHSVRAVYLYSGMTDLAMETKDKALLETCKALFTDITRRKMYVTGGIGSTCIGEAFTVAYDLPNATAYTETCASIGLIFFANRLFKADPTHPSRYHDAVELELYNGALSGLSLDGKRFFYENPLEINLAQRHRITSTHERERFPISQRPLMFGCSCCPPNINRLLASLGEYVYACDEEKGRVYINQFAHSEYNDGKHKVTVKTDYPVTGKMTVVADCETAIRIPGWCHSFTAARPYTTENGYAVFSAGETEIEMDMTPYLVSASVGVVKNIGKAALRRGPMIYCAEGVDNPSVHTLYYPRSLYEVKEELDPILGITLTLEGYRRVDKTDALYMPLEEVFIPATIRLVPYHAFANRGETDMLVYLNYR